jgi:hypothetical protein
MSGRAWERDRAGRRGGEEVGVWREVKMRALPLSKNWNEMRFF